MEEETINDKLAEKLSKMGNGRLIAILIVLVLVGGMVIGFVIGMHEADNIWRDYHEKYAARINEECTCRSMEEISEPFPVDFS